MFERRSVAGRWQPRKTIERQIAEQLEKAASLVPVQRMVGRIESSLCSFGSPLGLRRRSTISASIAGVAANLP